MSLARFALDSALRDRHLSLMYAGTEDADPAAIEEARQKTHDGLMAQLGAHRRSGVVWLEFAAPRGVEVLKELGVAPDVPDLIAYLKAHPFGRLVVAIAETDEPVGRR